jgi:hypothetical protein
LEANGFIDWVPPLTAGQLIVIHATVVMANIRYRQMQIYPACNSTVNDVLTKITNLINQLTNNWILATHFWNDAALWIDTKLWND